VGAGRPGGWGLGGRALLGLVLGGRLGGGSWWWSRGWVESEGGGAVSGVGGLGGFWRGEEGQGGEGVGGLLLLSAVCGAQLLRTYKKSQPGQKRHPPHQMPLAPVHEIRTREL
jgi:hypothetical protein